MWRIIRQITLYRSIKKLVIKGKIMSIQQVSFQECSNQFSKIFERVIKNHEVISVCKESEQAIVILDAKEYSSLIETLNLLSNPINAKGN
jgi:antitoxin YefM